MMSIGKMYLSLLCIQLSLNRLKRLCQHMRTHLISAPLCLVACTQPTSLLLSLQFSLPELKYHFIRFGSVSQTFYKTYSVTITATCYTPLSLATFRLASDITSLYLYCNTYYLATRISDLKETLKFVSSIINKSNCTLKYNRCWSVWVPQLVK